MKKRIIALCLAILSITSLTACGEDKENDNNTPTQSTVSSNTNNKETTPTSSGNSSNKEISSTDATTATNTPEAPTAVVAPEKVEVAKPAPDSNSAATPATKPQTTSTPKPTEPIVKVEDVVDFTIPEAEEVKNDFIARTEKANIKDSEGVFKFSHNGKTYSILDINKNSLEKSGVYLVEKDAMHYACNKWNISATIFGTKNNKGNLQPSEQNFYVELANDGSINSIAIDDDYNTNISFYKGIKIGMTNKELAPLLKNAVKQEKGRVTAYLFKDSKTSLIVNTIDGVVDFIILAKNSVIKDWTYVPY